MMTESETIKDMQARIDRLERLVYEVGSNDGSTVIMKEQHWNDLLAVKTRVEREEERKRRLGEQLRREQDANAYYRGVGAKP